MKTISSAMFIAPLALGLGSGDAAAQGQITGNAFNPAVGLILIGNYADYSNDPRNYGISGFVLGEEAGLAAEGLSIDESELTLSANVDDKFYGFATLALEQDAGETHANIEEAWFETLALPGGLKVKAGRFFSDIGYLNAVHPHAWDFADAPLAYTAMVGSNYGDSGVQLKWVAPTILFVEIGAELMRGDSFPGAGAEDANGTGAHAIYAHIGGDVGAENSWRTGVSYLSAEAHGRESPLDEGILDFTGDSDLTIVDFVWKWARNGNPRDRNFIAQAEYLHRSESGELSLQDFVGGLQSGTYDGDQDGWYVQGVYQFRPRWRVGLRFDGLSATNDLSGLTPPAALQAGHDPKRISAMVDFSNSEFSRLRLQFNRDESLPDTDEQLFVQYIMSLGAHGAHRF